MSISSSELRSRLEASLERRIPHALTPVDRPAPKLMPTGIAAVDALTGGIPLGCLTEICGPESSGRTSMLLAALSASIHRNEICALIDTSDAFDPHSAANAGMDLARLLWVRCQSAGSQRRRRIPEKNRRLIDGFKKSSVPSAVADRAVGDLSESSPLEQALKITDLLLQAGGFGFIVLDLADVPVSAARQIPLTTWFRFRRAVENTSTALVVVERYPHAKSCASLVMDFCAKESHWRETDNPETGISAHFGNTYRRDELDAVLFRVTPEGIAIPFDKPAASSFEMPQRWSTPHARLLNTVHVRLQVTRSRINCVNKFPACSEYVIPSADIARGIPPAQHSKVQ